MTVMMSGEPAASTRVRAVALLLPSALNLGIAQILAPALNALLARTSDPEPAIGGFAVALGISGLVALPQLRIQHLTLVFLDGRKSRDALRRFVLLFVGVVTAAAVLVALTPLAGILLEYVFATDGALRDEAASSLIALVPFPALAVLRMHLYGIALRAERPRIVWGGTVGGATSVLVIATALLLAGSDGAVLAAAAVSGGAAIECAALWFATQGIDADTALPDAGSLSQRTLHVFFLPLLFAAFLPAVSTPIIMAAVARAPEPNVSLAAFPLAMSVFTFATLVAGGVQPTVLALFSRGDEARGIGRFALLVGFVALGGILPVAWIPPLSELVVGDVLGAEGRLQDLTIVGLKVLSVLPPLMTLEQLYAAALLRTKRTRALVYVNAWRLLGLLLYVAIVPLTGWSGAAIGAGAVTFTLTLEAVVAWLYGRGSFRELSQETTSGAGSSA
jgi:hypothetical protein